MQTVAWPRTKPASVASMSAACLRMTGRAAARQQAVHGGNDPVPVAQQVEGDDGRDDREAEQVDEREPAAQHAPGDLARPAGGGGDMAGQRPADALHVLRRKLRLQPRCHPRDRLLQGFDIAGQGGGETGDLGVHHRQEQQQHAEARHREAGEHEQGPDRPPDAAALQPVHQRVEEIGDGDAGDERQQYVLEEREEEHRPQRDDEPDSGLPCRTHAAPPPRSSRIMPRIQMTT